MTAKRALFPCLALLLAAGIGSPAAAGDDRRAADTDDWRAIHRQIYELENRIAFLQADPETDDGYRAPIIARARAEIARLRATLGPARWRWPSPCCYDRKPIVIR